MTTLRNFLESVPVLLAASALLAVIALPTRAEAAEPRLRVLIVDGCSNHDWRLTTRSIRAILDATGLFDVVVSSSSIGKRHFGAR
jgi:hypothetical protein